MRGDKYNFLPFLQLYFCHFLFFFHKCHQGPDAAHSMSENQGFAHATNCAAYLDKSIRFSCDRFVARMPNVSSFTTKHLRRACQITAHINIEIFSMHVFIQLSKLLNSLCQAHTSRTSPSTAHTQTWTDAYTQTHTNARARARTHTHTHTHTSYRRLPSQVEISQVRLTIVVR